ncbi:MAG: DUF1385 domain-containing protein [Maledivibacter sp.]|jgi:uncharacterized protein YqhQ|nr:DUF1385 domain-containing protein [Maledivibacter sp.]
MELKDKAKRIQPGAVGGQALIEGVMMKSPHGIAMAVRKSDGEIVIKKEPIGKIEKSPLYKVPIIRGIIAFFNSMVVGVRAITYSAEVFEEIDSEVEKGKFEKWLEEKFGDKSDDIITYFSVALAIAMALVIFMFIPTFLINFLKTRFSNQVVLSGFEGILKIFMFIGYIILISRLKEIRRVFEYHGAEHKVIFCYESGKSLTPENAREFTTLHPRCGTSFLVFVMVISIVLFSFIGWESPVQRVLTKLVLLPLVAGISYEIIKIAGKSKSKLVGILSYPGLMLQKLTTKEPDDKQLEVAIEALKNVLVDGDLDI